MVGAIPEPRSWGSNQRASFAGRSGHDGGSAATIDVGATALTASKEQNVRKVSLCAAGDAFTVSLGS